MYLFVYLSIFQRTGDFILSIVLFKWGMGILLLNKLFFFFVRGFGFEGLGYWYRFWFGFGVIIGFEG